jgi:transcriptional regulator with XRE-family HTH domain
MPRESTLKLAPLPRGKESLGQRLARFRKERGYAQTELAAKIGLIQALVSDYERDKLRMNSDTILRFAGALEVSTDELLRAPIGIGVWDFGRSGPRRPPGRGPASSRNHPAPDIERERFPPLQGHHGCPSGGVERPS